jgi:hypothetical protein
MVKPSCGVASAEDPSAKKPQEDLKWGLKWGLDKTDNLGYI